MKMKIIEQASRLFLEYGFKSVTMDDLSEKLGVSKKTIYEHFDTKTQLVKATTNNIFEHISCIIDELCEQNLDPIAETLAIKDQVMKHLKNEKSLPQYQLQKYYPTISQSLRQKQWDKMYECYRNNLKRGVEQGFYRKDIDIECVFRFYYNGMNLVKDQNVFPYQQFSSAHVKEQYLEYHLRGIVTSKGLKRLEELHSEYKIS
ncbi:TetR/AcrR family transcriptional regulator [Flavobacteriaceae bacterium 14752]|uniref:TetR/AcrR family transcriptional regulator n=1 Tax=Mesohalobacter salilacus TaxID=2491711 RepID=UPI000F6333C7|nr:TetR/AcrR family transcriptional regulator [Flavobacteriaceae bacterium 14752]